MHRKLAVAMLLGLCLNGTVAAQPGPIPHPGTDTNTIAERVARLRRTIEDGEKRLQELNAQVQDPDGDYSKAEKEFEALDRELESKRAELATLEAEGSADEAATLQSQIEPLAERRDLAKNRFELAIQERRTLQQQIAAIEQKLAQDRDAVNKLLSVQVPASQPATQPAQPTSAAPAPSPTNAGVTEQGQPAEPSAKPGPILPSPLLTPAVPKPAEQATPAAPDAASPPSEEAMKAREEAQTKETEARAAEAEARSISERIDQLQKTMDLERKLLDTARKKADNARETERTLMEQVRTRSSDGAPQAELAEMWANIQDARKRYREADQEVTQRVNRIDRLQGERAQLQSEHIAALQEAEKKREAAEKAQKAAERSENPFAPRNLWLWVLGHVPRIIGIALGTFALLWLLKRLEGRLVNIIAGRTDRGFRAERENRAKTLVGVFHNTATVVIIAGAALMILAEFRVNIAPLLGGVAVIGLAVAFGAQNLIRDYFYGFMILVESQYAVNDVVRIGSVAGLVERITLRITVLRDLEGIAHFIPNGEIKTVSNLTYRWSRVVMDIGVAYKEDADRVMKVIMDVAMEVRNDPEFRPRILEDPEMLGLDEFADSAIVFKILIKTRPLQQWAVKRQILYRLKKKFDELGIEIPFPHRTVYHRTEPDFLPAFQMQTDNSANGEEPRGGTS